MEKIKKNWSNILFAILIVLLIIPQTRMPIQVFLQRMISFTPSQIDTEHQETLDDYNWPLISLSHEMTNLSSSMGKVTIINLWATWCPPCVAELPELQKLYDSYKDTVDFYFISYEKKQKLNDFMENKGYNLPVFRPMKKAPNLLESEALPTTFLISKTGKIIIKKTGAASWNSDRVHELLDTLLDQ
jgi:thiol-disulfide isomerase/thioredoxin